MFKTIGAMLGSVRLWIIVLTAVLAVLQGAPVVETIQAALLAIAAIGTVDKAAKSIGGK